MNIGLRLTVGFGMLLLVLGGVLAFGWDADRKLNAHSRAVQVASAVEIEVRALHTDVLSMMLADSFADSEALIQKSTLLDEQIERLAMQASHPDDIDRMRQVKPANEAFRKAVRTWTDAASSVEEHMDASETALVSFSEVLAGLGGKGRDSVFVHADGYASLALVRARFSELRLVNDIQRDVRLSREALEVWRRTRESDQLQIASNKLGAAIAFATELREQMDRDADKAIVDGMVGYGREYLAAVTALQEIDTTLIAQRAALLRTIEDMRNPLQRLAERHRSDVDNIREVGVVLAACTIGFGILWSLLIGTSLASGLRKRITEVREILLAFAAGDSGIRVPENGDDVHGLMDATRRLAKGEAAIVDAAQLLTRGRVDVSIPARSDRDLLSGALQQLMQANGNAVQVLGRHSEGDLRAAAVPRSADDAVMVAVQQTAKYWEGIVETTRKAEQGVSVQFGRLEEQCIALQAVLAKQPERAEDPVQMQETVDAITDSLQEITARAAGTVSQAAAAQREMARMETAMREMAARSSFADDVARQIDTLAMNISIEAARFGEEGRGLSGVVQELRGVVERCRMTSQSLTEHAEAGVQAMVASSRAMEDVMVNADSLADAKAFTDPVVARCTNVVQSALDTETIIAPLLAEASDVLVKVMQQVQATRKISAHASKPVSGITLPERDADTTLPRNGDAHSSDVEEVAPIPKLHMS